MENKPYIIDIYELYMRADGILRLHVTDRAPETIKGMQELFNLIGQLTNKQKVPLLASYDKFVFSSDEVNHYWSDPETCCPYISAEAFISNSVAQKLIGKFYISTYQTNRPVQMFFKEEAAIKWLLTFVHDPSST